MKTLPKECLRCRSLLSRECRLSVEPLKLAHAPVGDPARTPGDPDDPRDDRRMTTHERWGELPLESYSCSSGLLFQGEGREEAPRSYERADSIFACLDALFELAALDEVILKGQLVVTEEIPQLPV